MGSPFGPRSGGYHFGQDFEAKDGTPFYAIQSGTVQYIGKADGYGQWIVIDSSTEEGGGCLEYGHMWDAFATGLKVGSRVMAGQLLGYVGSNGESSGPHLHVTLHNFDYSSDKADPIPWMRNATYLGDPAPAPAPAPQGAPVTAPATKPIFREINMLGNNRSPRYGARVSYFLLHTEEGNSTAQQLANSLNNRDDASYHYTLKQRILCDLVDTDYASWSVLDANPRTINLCFAGSRASQTRQQWIDNFRDDIRIAAYIAVQDGKKYNRDLIVVQGRPYHMGNKPCIADHYFVTKVLGIGSHTDVGPNFPFDLLDADVKMYLKGVVVAPPVNEIDKYYNSLKGEQSWLGKRISAPGAAGENVCPDRVGRWAQYAGGYIYFTPHTGAQAVPNYIFETWKMYGFETGKLGYPVGHHSVMTDGEVQGFEHGAIYRKGHPGQTDNPRGWAIGGNIRNHWNKTGFEKGPYGYPIGDEVTTKSGAKWQQFEKNGRLVFSPDTVVGLVAQDGPDLIN